MTFFANQISDELQSMRAQNHLVAYMRLPLQHPRKSLNLVSFFVFSGKTRDNFRYYILYVQYVEVVFPVLPWEGVTNNLSLETTQRRTKNANFFNIH